MPLGEAMRRRDFISVIAGATAWPLAARAQQADQLRRIGVLSLLSQTDAETHAQEDAFRKRLADLGWVDGRNIRVDYRWGAGNVERVQQGA